MKHFNNLILFILILILFILILILFILILILFILILILFILILILFILILILFIYISSLIQENVLSIVFYSVLKSLRGWLKDLNLKQTGKMERIAVGDSWSDKAFRLAKDVPGAKTWSFKVVRELISLLWG